MVYRLLIHFKLGQPVAQLVQALRVRLEFFKDIILQACTMALGSIQPLTERQPVHRADNLTTFMYRMPWNLGTSTSWYPLGLSRPVQGLLYLYFYISNCYKIHINQYHISIISYLTPFYFRSYTALRLSSITVYLRIFFWNFRTYHLTESIMWLCISQYFIRAQVIYRRYHKGLWDIENVKSHVHIHMNTCTYCYEQCICICCVGLH